jgi:hypothetical protein
MKLRVAFNDSFSGLVYSAGLTHRVLTPPPPVGAAKANRNLLNKKNYHSPSLWVMEMDDFLVVSGFTPIKGSPEAEFLGLIGEFSSLLFTVTSTNGFYSTPPPPPEQNVYRNIKSENSRDYAQ